METRRMRSGLAVLAGPMPTAPNSLVADAGGNAANKDAAEPARWRRIRDNDVVSA